MGKNCGRRRRSGCRRDRRRPLLRSRQAVAFTTKDTLLIADFVNTTGDNVFDGTLKKALAVDLGQSPYLNVLSDGKVQQTLALMGKPSDTHLTPEIAREICQRNGVKALLTGSIASVGNQYMVTLAAINAASNDTLAEVQDRAESKEQVLKALDSTASQMRQKLGNRWPRSRSSPRLSRRRPRRRLRP